VGEGGGWEGWGGDDGAYHVSSYGPHNLRPLQMVLTCVPCTLTPGTN
jgi:hypothetical protein